MSLKGHKLIQLLLVVHLFSSEACRDGFGTGYVHIYILVYAFLLQMIFQERVTHHRQAEFEKRREEREEQINQIIQARKLEREAKRKKIYYVRSEEERLRKIQEEEEARKREGMLLNTSYAF